MFTGNYAPTQKQQKEKEEEAKPADAGTEAAEKSAAEAAPDKPATKKAPAKKAPAKKTTTKKATVKRGAKRAKFIAMLKRKNGATIKELIEGGATSSVGAAHVILNTIWQQGYDYKATAQKDGTKRYKLTKEPK